jgi:catechol-2,3-dioxygenase
MTQIRGFIEPLRRPGVLGVHSMDHFSMAVPDLAVAQSFYDDFGLDTHSDGRNLALHTFGHAHRWGVLSEGPRKKFQYWSFGAYEDDLPRFRAHLQTLGIPLIDPPPGVESNGLWFHDPDGNCVEIRVAEKSSPNEKTQFTTVSQGPGTRGAVYRSKVKKTQPRRLAHVLVFTPDPPRATQFYMRVLGLRLSDESEGNIAFLHGVHGSDHHLIAFARSNAPGFHHCSWDVGAVDDIGLGAMHMAEKGFVAGWGLGRHVLGSNYFHYVRDPWGSYSEYSADIDFIPVDADWDTADHPGAESFYLWGPDVPEDFVRNYEAG